jgi:hydrogenase maturation factor
MFVGDFVVDVEAGYRAGAITVYLPEPDEDEALEHEPDFRIDGLHELEPIVRLGLPLSKGKLPNEYLAQHLGGLAAADGVVLVGAGVGEDIAALDVSGDEVIVAHPDPITLATADLGRYSVLVNANDIATSGGDPLWFLTTVLLPPGTTPSEALRLLGEIGESCAAAGIALVGGHTEITDAVTRPTVAGTMLGTVARADLREKTGVSEGDRVVLTERIAVEGTALLAQELGERLRSLGMTEADLGACRALAERLSVLDAARVARRFEGVTAMHDVTEGGIATAVRELASASGHSLVVDIDRIPVFPETARVCELLGADPFGLIGSGSLLVCCRPDEADALVEALTEAGVEAAEVGEVSASGGAVTAQANGRPSKWPSFAVDEAARLLG